MGETKANRKAWRKKAFEKLGTKSLGDVQKPGRSNVLRSVLGMQASNRKKKKGEKI